MSTIPKDLREGQFASGRKQSRCCEEQSWLVWGNTRDGNTEGYIMSR